MRCADCESQDKNLVCSLDQFVKTAGLRDSVDSILTHCNPCILNPSNMGQVGCNMIRITRKLIVQEIQNWIVSGYYPISGLRRSKLLMLLNMTETKKNIYARFVSGFFLFWFAFCKIYHILQQMFRYMNFCVQVQYRRACRRYAPTQIPF